LVAGAVRAAGLQTDPWARAGQSLLGAVVYPLAETLTVQRGWSRGGRWARGELVRPYGRGHRGAQEIA
jgi:hypothetical protein